MRKKETRGKERRIAMPVLARRWRHINRLEGIAKLARDPCVCCSSPPCSRRSSPVLKAPCSTCARVAALRRSPCLRLPCRARASDQAGANEPWDGAWSAGRAAEVVLEVQREGADTGQGRGVESVVLVMCSPVSRARSPSLLRLRSVAVARRHFCSVLAGAGQACWGARRD